LDPGRRKKEKENLSAIKEPLPEPVLAKKINGVPFLPRGGGKGRALVG